MNYKLFFTFSFILLLTGFISSNQINYEINTTYPNSMPYYLGTQINDLKISLVDNNNQILDYNINSLNVRIGQNKYNLLKESNVYHLKDIIITKELLINNKLVIDVLTPLEGTFINTKQTYTIGETSELIKLKNNPIDEYKTLTIGQKKSLVLIFEDLKNQQISNLNCFLDSYNSDKIFDCSKTNTCSYLLDVTEDLNTINILCNFDKTIKDKKTYPLGLTITANLVEGIKISELTNPKDGIIGNPFEMCFNVVYANNDKITDYGVFKLNINNIDKEYYTRDNGFCFSKLLVPFTVLDENILFSFNNKTYNSQITKELNPGTYWTAFMIIIGIFILINLILILKAIFSKETLEDLTIQRDNYKTKLKEIKEKYLQGEINKREFDSKLNEYSIKISYLNERILNTKKTQNKPFEETTKEEKQLESEEVKENNSKKAPKELLNAIFSEKKEKVELKEEDIIVDQAQISDEKIVNYTNELSKTDISQKPKEESKFKLFFKNLFKKKPKLENQEEEKENIDNLKDTFKGYSNDNEFDIKNWQK